MIIHATKEHLDELEKLYNDLNDHLEANTNYPGWLKGVYPVRETAEEGLAEDSLFVFLEDNVIKGSIILNHRQEHGYDQVVWGVDANDDELFVLHILVVHPDYMGQGVAKKLLLFTEQCAKEKHMKTIRLDVSINNTPAIALYEACGYSYVGTVDLGLEYEHLKWFMLYELIV